MSQNYDQLVKLFDLRPDVPIDMAKIYSEKVLPHHPSRGGQIQHYNYMSMAFGNLAILTGKKVDHVSSQESNTYTDEPLGASHVTKLENERAQAVGIQQQLFRDRQFNLHTFNELFKKFHPSEIDQAPSSYDPEPSLLPSELGLTELNEQLETLHTHSGGTDSGSSIYWAWDSRTRTPQHISRREIKQATAAAPPAQAAPISANDIKQLEAQRSQKLEYNKDPIVRDRNQKISGYTAVWEGRLGQQFMSPEAASVAAPAAAPSTASAAAPSTASSQHGWISRSAPTYHAPTGYAPSGYAPAGYAPTGYAHYPAQTRYPIQSNLQGRHPIQSFSPIQPGSVAPQYYPSQVYPYARHYAYPAAYPTNYPAAYPSAGPASYTTRPYY